MRYSLPYSWVGDLGTRTQLGEIIGVLWGKVERIDRYSNGSLRKIRA